MSSTHHFPWRDVVNHERSWCESVVDAYGAAGVLLTESTLDLRMLSLLAHADARRLGILPLGLLDGWLQIAAGAPVDPQLLTELERCRGCSVVVLLAAAPLLPGAIDAAYSAAAAGASTLAGLRSSSSLPHLEVVRGRNARAEWLEPIASSHR